MPERIFPNPQTYPQTPSGTGTGGGGGGGDMLAANNLSELPDKSMARANLDLGNVDNTADSAKPISTAVATALAGKQPAGAYLTSITSGNVTGALGYTPTSVTGFTGVQSVAAFKTGLALVKGDVGLGNVDNTADSAKTVAAATRLTTARTINGVGFDGQSNITIPAVDTATPRLASSAVSTFMLTVLDDADAATARATLGAQVAGTYATGSGSASGANTGDETYTTITTKLAGGSGGGTTNFLRADGTFAAPPAGGGGVAATRAINTTAPLTGGGDLSADRTLAISAATTTTAGSMSAADKTKLDAIAGTNTGDETATSVVSKVAGQTIAPASVAATTSVGYGTGAGGFVTQLTSKSTTVVLNKPCGQITMNAAALAAGAIVTFTLTNSAALAEDTILTTHHAVGTYGAYLINARVTAAGTISVAVRNTSAVSLAEGITIKFAIVRTTVS